MARPTAAEIIEWSRVDFSEQDFSTEEEVQVLVDRAAAYIDWATGLDTTTLDDALLKPLADQAIQAKTEALAYAGAPDLIETLADFMVISSFSAGGYSETRRSIKDLQNAGMIDADPRINALLWPLLTEERRDVWLGWLSGKPAAAFVMQSELVVPWDWDDLMNTPISEVEPWSTYF